MQNVPKHTPGPWSVRELREDPEKIDDALDQFQIVADAKLEAIIAVIDIGSELVTLVDEIEPDQQRANAHLIAAAPELLEALKAIKVYYDDANTYPLVPMDTIRNLINKTVARATGGVE